MSMKSLLNSQVSYNRDGLTCCMQETGSKRPRFASRNRSSVWAIVLIVKLLNAQPPEFDVASVKPNKATAGERATSRENIDVTPGSLTMRNANLISCIKWAFDVREYQISGP